MRRDGWPADWEDRKRGRECSLCEPLRPPANDIAEVLKVGTSRAWLEWRSVLPGYCIVAWDGRHVAEIHELTPGELAAYWTDVAAVSRAVDAAFSPMKINLMTLGNWGPHLHTHVVPRYREDPAPGNPIAYEEMVQDQPHPEGVVRGWAARLSPFLPAPSV